MLKKDAKMPLRSLIIPPFPPKVNIQPLGRSPGLWLVAWYAFP